MFLWPLFFSIIFLLFNFCPCGAFLFRWVPSTVLSDPNNWLPSGSVPCANDNVRFDADDGASTDQNVVVAQLDGPLRFPFYAHIVTLPSNGILYFGTSNTEFGTARRAPNWQCENHDQPKDAIFNALKNASNFFDFSNWQILTENSAQMPLLLRLDAEKVPSEEDQVILSDEATSKVFIDVPTRVKSFKISGQSLSSQNLVHLLRTVEGQFRFRMGERINTAEVDRHKYLELLRPIETVFTVVGDDDDDVIGTQQKRRAEFFGRPNSNFIEPQFSALCGFVRCVPVESYCAEPILVIGQCCPQCGAMLRFRKNALNFTLAFAVANEFIRAQMATAPRGAGVSLVRVDHDDFHPLYQISVLPNHPANFGESEYCSIMWSVFRKIQQRTINAHLSIAYQPSDSAEFFDIRAKCSIQLGILHWKTVFKAIGFIALVCIVIGIVINAHYRHSPSFRLFVHDILSRQHQSMQVTWQGARERVEVISRGETERNAADRGDGASFLAEFANRAFSWTIEKKEDEAKTEDEAD